MRLTLCNQRVDETNEEQRASHKLREAAFCGRCVKASAKPGGNIEAVFTGKGNRRHYARVNA